MVPFSQNEHYRLDRGALTEFERKTMSRTSITATRQLVRGRQKKNRRARFSVKASSAWHSVRVKVSLDGKSELGSNCHKMLALPLPTHLDTRKPAKPPDLVVAFVAGHRGRPVNWTSTMFFYLSLAPASFAGVAPPSLIARCFFVFVLEKASSVASTALKLQSRRRVGFMTESVGATGRPCVRPVFCPLLGLGWSRE